MDMGVAPAGAPEERFAVVIVGAGLSGIGAAWHLRARCPSHDFVILEGRSRLGGTWDLFRYPGIRSDSDVHTLGYGFRPWRGERAITGGQSILDYVAATASEGAILPHIRFGHRLAAADWSSAAALWSLTVETEGGSRRIETRFLFMCSGYYHYDEPYRPAFPGEARFAGPIVHPQAWPEALDIAGKRIVVIGSGATAVTLVPALAETASHVTMLQRSPSYIVPRPSIDRVADRLNRRLPAALAHTLTRWRNLLLGMYFFQYARRRPALTRAKILALARRYLPEGYDVETHLSPRYDPWDQRLCLIPDADLFRAIRKGSASIVTGVIGGFTETGVALADGRHVDADIIVTATGLRLRLMGGAAIRVDGRVVDFGSCLTYKGMMFSDVPNLFHAFGYTNASWTLKAELIARHVCRLLRFMARRGYAVCTPVRGAVASGAENTLPLDAGYVRRGASLLPRQGMRAPWRSHQNYLLDLWRLRFSPLRDRAMRFDRAPAAAAAQPRVSSRSVA